MNKELLKVSLRQQALYLPGTHPTGKPASQRTLIFVVLLQRLGYALSEPLLRAFNELQEEEQAQILDVVNDVMGTSLNWASLTGGWLIPTGETRWDHFVTLMANILKDQVEKPGTTLPCGHLIPEGTFPLDRYNGCPFCGTPFTTVPGFVYQGQGTKLKVLSLWDDAALNRHFRELLMSAVPLDATQRQSLATLLRELPLPEGALPPMKETRMQVVDALVERGLDAEAGRFFASPADVMRYLWYRHTGHVQVVEPRTLLYIARKNQRHELASGATIGEAANARRRQLKLHYGRPWCQRVARWLNALPMPMDSQLESMHPKRQMWVRFIRALRLAEYAKRSDFAQLRTLLDRFYRQDYPVWQGQVDALWLTGGAAAAEALQLLQKRPGRFARCLFSAMLRLGSEQTLQAFAKVVPALPLRLLLTLGSQADLYFDRDYQRVVRTMSGMVKRIGPHPAVAFYPKATLEHMRQAVNQLYLDAMRSHFAKPTTSKTIYIDAQLDHVPVAAGDRSTTIQDTSSALQGMRFKVEGDAVRLFMQWGQGLPAQHLDMDLSCKLFTPTMNYDCAYFNLSPVGARHSGDIQHIPDQVGTAEYIELQLPELERNNVELVAFTCNAYTQGALQPNLMVGWMSAKYPMAVDDKTGVAYDPSTVQHQVRISESNLSKGLIFGVLDVPGREITWLEMPFDGQTVRSLNRESLVAMLQRLRSKPTIGQVLRLKAEAQHLALVDTPEQADEVYTPHTSFAFLYA